MLWHGHSVGREARIEWVCTEPSRQRSGCGRALLARALTEARSQIFTKALSNANS